MRTASHPPMCEQVIDSIVAVGRAQKTFDRSALRVRVASELRGSASGMDWWIDHIVGLMVHRRLIVRRHLGPGRLIYQRTALLEDYEALLDDLIAPPFARDEYRAEKARKRRQRMRDLSDTT